MADENKTELFAPLPDSVPPLAHDEASLLRHLPIYGEDEHVTAIQPEWESVCRRLEKRGLVKVRRWKDDPISIRPTLYAGRLA